MKIPRLIIAMTALGLMMGTVDAGPREHDSVRRAVEHGEIRSLSSILGALRGKLPGEVTGIEIERENGHWVYEFRVVDAAGRLLEIYVDARSAEIVRTKEK